MLNPDGTLTQVFTQHDVLAIAIHVPVWQPIVPERFWKTSGLPIMESVEDIIYDLYQIDYGLCGVRFAHYRDVHYHGGTLK